MYSPMTASLVGRMASGSAKLLAATVRHHGKLWAEALDVLGLALEEAHRNQQREVGVPCAGGLDPCVDLGLHPLPDRVAGGPDDHGSTGWPFSASFALVRTS